MDAQAARARWARSRAMVIIPRVAARRSFADLLHGATEDQLLAVITVLADREALARTAHAERARRGAERLPESLAELARDYDRVRAQRKRATRPAPMGVLAQIRHGERVRGEAAKRGERAA
jgi:hypothetical protein